MCLDKELLKLKNKKQTTQLKVGQNDYSTNQKKVSVAILISKLISEQNISGTMGVISWWLILWEDIAMKVYASKIYEAKL